MKKSNNYISNFSLKLYHLCQIKPVFRRFKSVLYFIDFFLLLFIKKNKKYTKNTKNKKQILILYNYAFGDGIIFLSSIKHIRKIYSKKEYEITLICQKGLKPLYVNQNIFDNVIDFNLTKATFNLRERYTLFKLLRSRKYDILLDPIGVGECTTNVFMSRAVIADEKITILDDTLDIFLCPKWMYEKIYTKVIHVTTLNLSLLEYYGKFMEGLGLINFNVKLEKLNSYSCNIDLPDKYGIIFPNASTEFKKWSLLNYAEIAKKIYKKTRIPIVLCGTSADLKTSNEFQKLIDKDIQIINIINNTNILEFIEVIKKAQYVITNDTSAYHIAVTQEVPVAIITGGYTYNRYVKYDFKEKNKYKKPYIISSKTRKCFNCDNRCPYLTKDNFNWPCLEEITVDNAWKKIEKLIDDNKIGGQNEYRKTAKNKK